MAFKDGSALLQAVVDGQHEGSEVRVVVLLIAAVTSHPHVVDMSAKTLPQTLVTLACPNQDHCLEDHNHSNTPS